MDSIKQIKDQLKKAKQHEQRIKKEIEEAAVDQHFSDALFCVIWDAGKEWTGVARGLSIALCILEGKDEFE